MFIVLKKLTLPYNFRDWHLSLIAALPQIIGGFLLTFHYSAHNMGVPWHSKFNDLPMFKISSGFVAHVREFGSIFTTYPVFFSYAAALSMFFGGICLMVGCLTRFASFLIFWVMIITLFFREFDHSWSYIPTFAFLSISILGIWFGSGRLGVDYFISKKMNWI